MVTFNNKIKTMKNKSFTLSKDQVNSMLQAVEECIPFLTNSVIITQKMIDQCQGSEDGEIPNELLGYKVKRKVVGDHRNDGQMVDYTFTFISPDKDETIIETDMCLMIGWNVYEDVKFK